eukprot:2001920-Prymnesium_polylepis.1
MVGTLVPPTSLMLEPLESPHALTEPLSCSAANAHFVEAMLTTRSPGKGAVRHWGAMTPHSPGKLAS